MEDNCDLPTDMMISVQADGDSWIAVVAQEGPAEDAGRRQTIEQLAAQLKAEFDLKQAGTILAEVRTKSGDIPCSLPHSHLNPSGREQSCSS